MRLAVVAALAITFVPATARAERRVASEWYGWQNLSVDAAALSTLAFVSRSRTNEEELAWAGVLLYAFGGPSVHWAHGNVGKGFGSLGLRTAGPVVGGITLCAAMGDSGEFGCLAGLALGGLLGIGAAVAVDSAALAYDEVEIPRSYALRVRPIASITPQASTFGIGGSF